MEDLLNKQAPDFKLPDQDETLKSLSDYRGSYVLLYFYPKDMTSGCTTEAQCFRDKLNDLKALGVQVLGVSVDSTDSHKKFVKMHNLNFPLLSDANKEVVKKYGVWGENSTYAQRDSFLIDKEGRVIKHYVKVKPEIHVDDVIKDVKAL